MNRSLRVHDLSIAFTEGMLKYPASWFPEFKISEIKPEDMPEAAWKRRFTTLELFVHNGTHVESSDHVTRDGFTIDQVPLSNFIGFPMVLDFTDHPDAAPITRGQMENKLSNMPVLSSSIILIKTTYNDREWGGADYWLNSPFLESDAARCLAELEPALIGLDFQTEKPGEREFPVHRELLKGNTVLCEYLVNLKAVGADTLFAAIPVKIAGVEAACVRAVAIEGLNARPDPS